MQGAPGTQGKLTPEGIKESLKTVVIKLHFENCMDISWVQSWEESSKRDISGDGIVLRLDYVGRNTNICR